MKLSKRTLGLLVLIGILIFINIHIIFMKVWDRCEGTCYQIDQTAEFEIGGYPRMAQVDDLLLVAYSNGSFVLDGINLTTSERIGPRVIISDGINPDRSTLFYSEDLNMVNCVFNHDDAASCGIAWVPKSQILNVSAWNIQYAIIGPVYKDFFHVGLWEPYLAPYNSSTFLLYVSNQTIYDPESPIDVEHYYFTLEGYKVVQKIEIYWITWNGTGFESSYCGVASQSLPGGPIHYKDGMASSVLITGNNTCKEYLMTFEAFAPPAKIARITMVKLRISDAGVQTLWRNEITHEVETAPFITSLNGTLIVSFKHQPIIGQEGIGFIGLKEDQETYSKPIYLSCDLFGWPSVLTDDQDRLWIAGTNRTNGKVTILELSLDFNWKYNAPPYNLVLFHQVFGLFLLFLFSIIFFRQPILRPNQFFSKLAAQKTTPSEFLPLISFTLLSGLGFASFTYFEYFDFIYPISCGLILFLWIYYSSISYVLGRILKLKADFLKTIKFTQYFFIPLLMFFFILNTVLSIFGPEMLWYYVTQLLVDPLALIIAGIIAMIFLIWFIVLALLNISANFQASLKKSLLIILIPLSLLSLILYFLISNYIFTLFPL